MSEGDYVFSRGADELHEMVRGEGIYLWDVQGNRYIDRSSGPLCVT
ncbi:MAG: hypothetical protein ACLFVP_00890 [Candidatus Bathyarchaeia archaeon]